MWHALFSLYSVGAFAIACGVAALILFLRGWTKLALIAVAVGAGHFYAGTIYQMGFADCTARVQAEVKAEHERQAEINARNLDWLAGEIDVANKDAAADDQRIAAYEAQLAALPKTAACSLTDADVKAINGR